MFGFKFLALLHEVISMRVAKSFDATAKFVVAKGYIKTKYVNKTQ